MRRTHASSNSRLRQPALLCWLRLARVFQKISVQSARQFADYNLTTAQFDVLAQLSASEGMSQQELANVLLVTKGNISQLVDRMEEKGLVRRCQEGRTNTLYLSDRGRELAAELVPTHEMLMAAQFQSLSEDEQRTLLRFLRRLDQSVDD